MVNSNKNESQEENTHEKIDIRIEMNDDDDPCIGSTAATIATTSSNMTEPSRNEVCDTKVINQEKDNSAAAAVDTSNNDDDSVETRDVTTTLENNDRYPAPTIQAPEMIHFRASQETLVAMPINTTETLHDHEHGPISPATQSCCIRNPLPTRIFFGVFFSWSIACIISGCLSID
ncbi:13325_t:CDS:2 [Ambispora leptoticha]|uniref:13325_t:CDS:1 n=1 Tax=Ambispora leptoticha TaxID=144679 RepID=A0A9N9G5X1_9GLOM|nr:13325_t:CDS:2 [Ambispora leptoticha]